MLSKKHNKKLGAHCDGNRLKIESLLSQNRVSRAWKIHQSSSNGIKDLQNNQMN